jgi:hypothetical protein
MSISVKLIIALFAAHMIGDYLLQREKDVLNKHRFGILTRHASILGFFSYLLSGLWPAVEIFLVIFLAHFIFDYVKAKQSNHEFLYFIIDQLAHFMVIGLLVWWLSYRFSPSVSLFWDQLFAEQFYYVMVLFSGFVMTVFTGNVVVGIFVDPFQKQLGNAEDQYSESVSIKPSKGFKNGGRIIGQLERALIYIFILVNQPAAIGFLIAAKSVLRFGEIKDRANRMEAEYIIIGTLMSFLFGISISYLTKFLLQTIF